MAKPAKLEFQFPADGIIRGMTVMMVVLLIIHALLTICHYRWIELPWLLRELFDVDEEESIPTWFSTSLLFLAAATLTYITWLKRRVRDGFALQWSGLAVGFLFLSVDEVAGFHETLNSVIEISWAVPGLVIAGVVGIAYLRFLAALQRPVAVRFMLAGAIYLGGAIGVELATEPYLYNDALDTLGYNLWTPVEEGMEMGGVIFFLATLWQYIRDNWLTTVILQPRN